MLCRYLNITIYIYYIYIYILLALDSTVRHVLFKMVCSSLIAAFSLTHNKKNVTNLEAVIVIHLKSLCHYVHQIVLNCISLSRWSMISCYSFLAANSCCSLEPQQWAETQTVRLGARKTMSCNAFSSRLAACWPVTVSCAGWCPTGYMQFNAGN